MIDMPCAFTVDIGADALLRWSCSNECQMHPTTSWNHCLRRKLAVPRNGQPEAIRIADAQLQSAIFGGRNRVPPQISTDCSGELVAELNASFVHLAFHAFCLQLLFSFFFLTRPC